MRGWRSRHPASPIRIILVHLLVATGFREAVAAGQLPRVLFLDGVGHIGAQSYDALRADGLILSSNQQGALGPLASVQVLRCTCASPGLHCWTGCHQTLSPATRSGAGWV
jgi:hypothetical protein